MFEILKAIFLGIIQGITEWLPISSTGHMILFNTFFPFDESSYSGGKEFVELFLTVIQLGSILAVVSLFFKKLNFFSRSKSKLEKKNCFKLWQKIFVASLPAVFFGLILKDVIHKYFYNAVVVSLMLILYGIFFILAENYSSKSFKISNMLNLNFKTAFLIGVFQALALVPGTSRSGATILGALLLGCSRSVGAEFSFFLAIPTMFGASFLEIASYFKHNGFGFSALEFVVLTVGFTFSFFVSIVAISIFLTFIKRRNFKVFAYYRILIGILFILIFIFKKEGLKI